MTNYVTSGDGTAIAFDRLGDGVPLIVIGGLFCDRQRMRDLAEQLAKLLDGRFSVVNYDRRGRGDSGDTAPYAVEREIEDLAALIAATGGTAAVYGHSSGAGLALRAAAAGLPITRLVLHEPPYGADNEESTDAARNLANQVRMAVEAGQPAAAIATFMSETGAPSEVVEAMTADPALLVIARTMPYDHEVMGDYDQGGTIPEQLVASIDMPTLVIAGGASPDFFRDTADRIAALLSNGTIAVLDGHGHEAPADIVAPAVAGFLSDDQ